MPPPPPWGMPVSYHWEVDESVWHEEEPKPQPRRQRRGRSRLEAEPGRRAGALHHRRHAGPGDHRVGDVPGVRESGAAGTKGQKHPAPLQQRRGVFLSAPPGGGGTQRAGIFSHPPGNAIAKPVRSTPVSVCSLYQIRPHFAIDSNVKNSTIFSLFFARPSCRNTKFHFLSSPGGCLSAVSGVQHGRSSDSGEKNALPAPPSDQALPARPTASENPWYTIKFSFYKSGKLCYTSSAFMMRYHERRPSA